MTETSKWQKVAIGLALVAVAVPGVVVLAAPLALSFHSLEGWARDSLGLSGSWPKMVPLALDATAIAYVALAFYASLKGESAGAARLLVWVVAGASALGNWRHGSVTSVDAAVFHASMPLSAALYLELVLHWVRRSVLGRKGALERALPQYRFWRWLVAPAETFRAWKFAVREGVTDPMAALEFSRQRRSAAAESVSDGPEEPESTGPADDQKQEEETDDAVVAVAALRAADNVPADIDSWKKRDAIVYALDRLAHDSGYDSPAEALTQKAIAAGQAHTWLASRGVTVNSNYAYRVATELAESTETKDRPPVLALAPASA